MTEKSLLARQRLLLGLVLLLAALHVALYDMPFEDAYISFRYVRNWVTGVGLVYDPGERVEGFTSFGWVVLLAGFSRLGLAVPRVATWLSMLFGVGLIAATASFAKKAWPRMPYAHLAPPLVVVAQGTFAYYAGSGMETTLFSFLVVVTARLVLGEDLRGAAIAGAVLAIAAMIRPEGPAYFAAIAAALLATRSSRRAVLPFSAVFIGLFLPWFLWRWHYFGWPLPNTFYAKATPSWQRPKAGLAQLEQFFVFGGFLLAVVGLAVDWRAARALPKTGVGNGSELASHEPLARRIAFFVLGAATANMVIVGGDAFPFFRFMLPAIPFAALGMTAGARTVLLRMAARRSWSDARVIATGTALALAFSTWSVATAFLPRWTLLSGRHGSEHDAIVRVQRIDRDYFVVGRFLRAALDPGTLIATNAAGIVPYESELPTIDMLGLNDAHIAHAIHDRRGFVGHQTHDASYVVERNPAVILPGLPLLTKKKLEGVGFSMWLSQWLNFLPGDAELLMNPEFKRRYSITSVEVAGHGWLTMLLRNDPRPKLHLRRAAAELR